jgi:hypothetical protein
MWLNILHDRQSKVAFSLLQTNQSLSTHSPFASFFLKMVFGMENLWESSGKMAGSFSCDFLMSISILKLIDPLSKYLLVLDDTTNYFYFQ